jgi:hypothetical protein
MQLINHKMIVRKVRIQCPDELGQRATFTVDETGKQNSPSFDSYYDLLKWADQPHNYAFKAEMRASN